MTRSVRLDANLVLRREAFALEAQLTVEAGQRLAVLGPNGAGKSTLLWALAGFLDHAQGTHRLSGTMKLTHADATVQHLLGPGVRQPVVQRRGIGILEQQPHLFPHFSALDNVAFGPRSRGIRTSDARRRARVWLDRVELAGYEARRPHELSGGQQQRVAIARALAAEPNLLVLDEPFAALDADTTPRVRAILARELEKTHTTTVFTTHTLEDVWQLGTQCVVMEEGRITERSSPLELASEPRTRFSAALAGIGVISGRTINGDFFPGQGASSETALGFARPSHVGLHLKPVAGGIEDTIASMRSEGGVIFAVGQRGLIADLAEHQHAGKSALPHVGQRAWWKPHELRVVEISGEPGDPVRTNTDSVRTNTGPVQN